MSFVTPSYRLQMLDDKKCQKLDFYARKILKEVGMFIGNEKAKKRLLEAGAKLNEKSNVLIPDELVDKALKTVPSHFKLFTVNGEVAMDVDKKNKYFGGSTSGLAYIDPETGKKLPNTLERSSNIARVGDALPNVHYLANNGLVSDVDPRIAGRINFSNCLRYTTKPMYFSSDTAATYRDIIALASDIKGGSKQLREKPFLFGYCEPIPPLNHSDDALEKLIICAETGIPVVYMPYCMRGGTAPITLAAALAQNFAEILTGVVIHQLFGPGSPLIAGSMPSIMDMRTTTGSYGAPEFSYAIALSADMCYYYHLPFFGTAGCTDSQQLDIQTGSEITMALLSSILTSADIIHDFGVMQHGASISPDMFVLANEILDMLHIYQEEIDFSDEAFLFDVIKKIGPKGHYLEEPSTLENFKCIWYSKIFDRTLNGVLPDNIFLTKLRKKTMKLINTYENEDIKPEVVKIVDSYEKKWQETISK